ncbi:MAG: ABC transporter permease [Fimbriimonadaceae bacterium]|nr:ABC transporter permease [Fimbriimonadaceae bacterium]
MEDLKELWAKRELLWAMTEREVRIRYKNSALGFLWSLAMPLAFVVVMKLVFEQFLGNRTDNYSAYLLAAYLPFLFMNSGLMDSAQSVLASIQVIKKVHFPREILPLSTVFSNFIHLLLSLAVFFVFIFGVWAWNGFGISPFTWKLLFLPILLLVTLAFTIGLSLIISSLNVFYEDVKHMLGLLLYLVFFLTPIMYFSENVYHRTLERPWLFWLYHLNPFASAAVLFRRTLLPTIGVDVGGETLQPIPTADIALLFGLYSLMAALTLWFGWMLFQRLKWRFVERP